MGDEYSHSTSNVKCVSETRNSALSVCLMGKQSGHDGQENYCLSNSSTPVNQRNTRHKIKQDISSITPVSCCKSPTCCFVKLSRGYNDNSLIHCNDENKQFHLLPSLVGEGSKSYASGLKGKRKQRPPLRPVKPGNTFVHFVKDAGSKTEIQGMMQKDTDMSFSNYVIGSQGGKNECEDMPLSKCSFPHPKLSNKFQIIAGSPPGQREIYLENGSSKTVKCNQNLVPFQVETIDENQIPFHENPISIFSSPHKVRADDKLGPSSSSFHVDTSLVNSPILNIHSTPLKRCVEGSACKSNGSILEASPIAKPIGKDYNIHHLSNSTRGAACSSKPIPENSECAPIPSMDICDDTVDVNYDQVDPGKAETKANDLQKLSFDHWLKQETEEKTMLELVTSKIYDCSADHDTSLCCTIKAEEKLSHHSIIAFDREEELEDGTVDSDSNFIVQDSYVLSLLAESLQCSADNTMISEHSLNQEPYVEDLTSTKNHKSIINGYCEGGDVLTGWEKPENIVAEILSNKNDTKQRRSNIKRHICIIESDETTPKMSRVAEVPNHDIEEVEKITTQGFTKATKFDETSYVLALDTLTSRNKEINISPERLERQNHSTVETNAQSSEEAPTNQGLVVSNALMPQDRRTAAFVSEDNVEIEQKPSTGPLRQKRKPLQEITLYHNKEAIEEKNLKHFNLKDIPLPPEVGNKLEKATKDCAIPIANQVSREPFKSSDPRENHDIEHPDWDKVKKLSTDEERYQQVSSCWQSKTVPNPNRDLTHHSFRKKNLPRAKWATYRQHKRQASENIDPRCAKRMRTKSVPCTETIDLKIEDMWKKKDEAEMNIRAQYHKEMQLLFREQNREEEKLKYVQQGYGRGYNFEPFYDSYTRAMQTVSEAILQRQHESQQLNIKQKYGHELHSMETCYSNEIDMLQEVRKEINKFCHFYKGLTDAESNPTVLTEAQLEELNEIENMYSQFQKHYRDPNYVLL